MTGVQTCALPISIVCGRDVEAAVRLAPLALELLEEIPLARRPDGGRCLGRPLACGVPHGVALAGEQLFFAHVHLHGGPAPVRRYLPQLISLVLDRKINPGKVFDLTLPLDQVAEGYRAMDERRAIKTLLRPNGTK